MMNPTPRLDDASNKKFEELVIGYARHVRVDFGRELLSFVMASTRSEEMTFESFIDRAAVYYGKEGGFPDITEALAAAGFHVSTAEFRWRGE